MTVRSIRLDQGIPIRFYNGSPMFRVVLRRRRFGGEWECGVCLRGLAKGEHAWRTLLNGGPVQRYIRICDGCMEKVGRIPERRKM